MSKNKIILPILLLSTLVMSGCTTNHSTNKNENDEQQIANDDNNEEIFYKVKFITNGGTLPDGYKTTVNVSAMSTYKLPLPTKEGNSFDGWFLSENEGAEQFPDNSSITSDLTLYAKWSEIQYKITYNLNGGVNDAMNPLGFSISSQDIVLRDPIKEGSVFLGWTSDDENVPKKNYKIITGTSKDKVVTANWYETARIANNSNLEEPDKEDKNYTCYNVLDLQKNNVFTLAFFCIYENGYVKCEAECGTYKQEKNGVIRLMFNSSRQDEFVIHEYNRYIFTDVNGTPISEIGNEGTEIIVDNAVKPFIEGKDRYGYRSLNFFENAKELQQIYNKIWEKCEEVIDSKEDITNSTLIKIHLNEFGVSWKDYLKVFKLFLLDNPQYYFVSRTTNAEGGDAILKIEEDYLNADERSQINADIEMIIENCAKTLTADESDLSRYLAIHNYVVSLIDYAYDTDGTPSDEVWAHNIVGATKGLGVCQSYADLFDLLCISFGLEDIQITGNIIQTNESHVWNLIQVDDLYYAVDATWDDLGGEQVGHSFFGLSYADINRTRTTHSSKSTGIDYLYTLPKMSNKSMELVYLNRENTPVNACTSIDDALNNINESEYEYTIELFTYRTQSGPLLMAGPEIKYSSSISQWPEAKKITLTGIHYDLGGGYIANSVIQFNQNTTFNSDIEFVNSSLITKDVSLCFDGHTLTTSGYYCQIKINLESENGNFECKTSYETECYGSVKVNECNNYGSCCFRNNVVLKKLNYLTSSCSINLTPYEVSEPTFKVDEIILHVKNPFSTMFKVRTYAYDHYNNPDNRIRKYNVVIDNIINNADETFAFKIRQSFDYDNEIANVSITGTLSDNLNLAVYYNGETTTEVTDAAGNFIDRYTLEAEISSGQKLLYAPNIDTSKIVFCDSDNESNPYNIIKGEDGYFIKN